MKRQDRHRRVGLTPVESLETRALMTIAATAQLPALALSTGTAPAPVNLDSYFKDPAASPDFAIFNTTLGTIPVLLTPKTTPITVNNFLNYVDSGAYTNTIVHRSVPGFIWQAGGFTLSGTSSAGISTIKAGSPIQNEFGASNVRGTIAMAKLGSDPNSATNEFFFNESDSNAANLDNQNGGFTVFGHVVGDQGLAVMDAVAAVPVPSPGPLSSPLDQIPLQNYNASTGVQAANLILIKSITPASELYLASSDTPNIATASVQGNNLTITPLSSGTAHITVVGYGSDGISATESFAVNVSGPTVAAPPMTSTPTSTSTTTSVPSMTTQAPAVASSVLTPSARGSIPASAVAGHKVKIQETVSLAATSGAVAQKERVALDLSTTTTGSPDDITIAGASTKVKLKVGKAARVTLSARQISGTVPEGTYHVLVSVTDPDGASTTIDTGKTLMVSAS